jgi:hypothetical protein
MRIHRRDIDVTKKQGRYRLAASCEGSTYMAGATRTPSLSCTQ